MRSRVSSMKCVGDLMAAACARPRSAAGLTRIRQGLFIGIACLGAWIAAECESARAGTPAVVLGPAEEIGLVEDFTADRQPLWSGTSGSNVALAMQAGYELPGVAGTLLFVDVAKRDPKLTDPGAHWLRIDRSGLPAGAVPAGADGLRVALGARADSRWWIEVRLGIAGGRSFAKVIVDGGLPAGRMIECDVPWGEFRAADGAALTPADAVKLRGISLTTSVGAAAGLYVDRITAYRQERFTGWLDLTASHAETQIYERGEKVDLTFAVGGTPPAEARGFRYEIRDYDGRPAGGATVALTGTNAYRVDATPAAVGYYEVRAYWTGADAGDLATTSCLRAEGTLPTGIGTFAVLPCTRDENIAMFRQLGDRAFFGIHGDFLGLGDLVGLSWRCGYTGWKWLEPLKPDRTNGPADWAAHALAASSAPKHQVHILPLRPNLGDEVPDWARRKGAAAPPFAEWEDYLAFVRDAVRVEKGRYPEQKPRLYGGAWEINLNMPPYVSQQPEFTAAEVAELFRRTREVVKAEDPDGLVLGPCPSVLNGDWFEKVFAAGVLEHLDAIETHGYMEGAYQPEENDYPGRLATLRALIRRHAGGRELPIYVTELGRSGLLGGRIAHREQAEHLVRMAIICKGEGVRACLPFYGIDFDRSGRYGFLFNKDVEPSPWSTRRCAPKPLVNAFAACVRALEGTEPAGAVRGLGADVHGYEFRGSDRRVTAVWTTGKLGTARLAAPQAVTVIDFMGRARQVEPVDGFVEVTVSGGASYVITHSTRELREEP